MNTQKNRRRYVVNREEIKTKVYKEVDKTTESKVKPTSKKKTKD